MSEDVNLQILIESLIKAIDEQKTALVTHVNRLDDIKVALEKQNLYNLPAGTIMNLKTCESRHEILHKVLEDHKASIDRKVKNSWIVLTFILAGYGATLYWIVEKLFQH